MTADQAAVKTTGELPEIRKAVSNEREDPARAKRIDLLDSVQRIIEILLIALAGRPVKGSGEEDGVDRAEAEENSIDRLGRRNEVADIKLNVWERGTACCRLCQPFRRPGQGINAGQG